MSGATLEPDPLIALRGLAQRRERDLPGLSTLPGNFRARRRGQGQEMADIRAYVPGDDVRSVDRNVTARTGSLHVREFQADRDRTLLLLADFRPSMLWGVRRAFRSVTAAEMLAILGWRAVEGGARVGLLAISAAGYEAIPARNRPGAMLAVIGGMVRAHQDAMLAARRDLADPPLAEALVQARRIMGRHTEVALASGFDVRGAGFEQAAMDIEHHGSLRRIPIGDGTASGLAPGRYRMATATGRAADVTLSGDTQEATTDVIDPGLPPQDNLIRLESPG